MAPKKAGKETVNNWRTHIEDACLDEETWKVKVIIIEAAGSDHDRLYLNKFETYAAEEKRFVIKNICKTETIFMVNQLGGEKTVKDDNLRVFEEGQTYIKDKQNIPPDVLALIIKHQIMKMKDDSLYIRKQRLEIRQGIRLESTTMIDRDEVRGTVLAKSLIPEPLPTPKGKSKKDDDIQLPEADAGKKYNTVLRVRGEEWRDRVYVDDFPLDGPQLYVAVTGFVETLLASCLIKIGVPLSAVVQVKIDPGVAKIPSNLLRSTKRGQSQTELLTDLSIKFWEDLQSLRINKSTRDDFKNTAFIVFSPPYWDTEQLSGKPDQIYDELCFLMYDVHDLTRQHVHYLENVDITKISYEQGDEQLNRHYNQLIADLPLECVTMYSVIDSILQTVCNNLVENQQGSEASHSSSVLENKELPLKSVHDDDKTEEAETLVKTIFKSLCETDATKKTYRSTFGEEYEAHKDPIVINYGNSAKINTFHIANINLDHIVDSSLYCMPLNKLWQYHDRPVGKHLAKINFHVNVLLSCFERADVEISELQRLIHVMSFRKLYNNRSSLKKRHLEKSTISDFKKAYLKRSVLAEPLPKALSVIQSASSLELSFPSMTRCENGSDLNNEDDPETRAIKYLFDCPDISELVSATDITTNGKPQKHHIDDFDYFEEFSGVSAYQIMTNAFNRFNCVDYKYCEVTDCFVLMFYNSHDKDGIAREEWRCHLATPLCLQDFFDFVLEEHYDWIQNEEKIYNDQESIKIQSFSKDMVDNDQLKSCLENHEVSVELLMEGSLKFQDAVMEDLKSEKSDTEFLSSQKTTLSPSTAPSTRKSKSPRSIHASTPKLSKRPSLTATVDRNSSINLQKKPFSGYDLGDRRVEIFGRDSTFFSLDGTRLTTLYKLAIPTNEEYVGMVVAPGNGSSEFWMHRALSETVSQEILDTCESFRITCKNEMMINIKKETYRLPVTTINISASETMKHKESIPNSIEQQMFEAECYHSLFITWPNGLITESVHEIDSPEISHIKQYQILPMPGSEEQMRCVSLNGEVLIFKSNGNVEVLEPNGTYIKITQYCKKIVLPDVPDELLSERSTDKVKKVKSKGKEKPSKISTKGKAPSPVEKHFEEKPPDVELVIEEFELTETSGLRQKWVNDTPADLEKFLIRKTDYCSGEMFTRRMDGTTMLINGDGVQVITFPNKTRIITYCVVQDLEIYPDWTDEEKDYLDMISEQNRKLFEENVDPKSDRSISQSQHSYKHVNRSGFVKKEDVDEDKQTQTVRCDGYISLELVFTIEHANYPSITINKAEGKISVDSPNGTQVVMNTDNTYDIRLDDATHAKFNGENLRIDFEACPECQSFTTCTIKIKSDDNCSVSKEQQKWLTMKDSLCNEVVVNEEGSIILHDAACSDDTFNMTDEVKAANEIEETCNDKRSVSKSLSEMGSKCREEYLAKTLQFFVLKRDLSCSELVHRNLLNQWQKEHRWLPWYSANNYDTFGDHRSLLSILSPLHVTETEKWLMNSSLADKPKNLTYKDLKQDDVKGHYHWMRPYRRFVPKPVKPAIALPPRLPRAYILRVLEQLWPEDKRDILKGGRELSAAILKYRHAMQADLETLLHVPIVDPRSDEERRIDELVQGLAERIYKDLQDRLDKDVRSRAKLSVTTEHLPEEFSSEQQLEEEMDYTKVLKEERASHLAELDAVVEMSPYLKKYWKKRDEEENEVQFFKYLLREGSVPPYFRNVLGGAFWWEVNDIAGQAVTETERNRVACGCLEHAEEE